jgi:hypothetical protein
VYLATANSGLIQDFTQYAFDISAASAYTQRLVFDGNIIDGDPWHQDTNRDTSNKDGTWQDQTTPAAFNLTNTAGSIATNNHIRNVSRVNLPAIGSGNILFAVPTATGFNGSNVGIGNLPNSGPRIIYAVEDGNPKSATFRQHLNACVTESASVPSSGYYVAGHFVVNTSQSVQRDGTLGWLRLTTGNGHTVGTDWKLIRPQVHPGYSTSSKIFSTTKHVAVSGAIAAADTLYLYPFFVPSTFMFTGGRVRTITGGASSAVKTAIYATDTTSAAAGNKPAGAPLVVDNTGAATTANNTTVTLGLGGTIGPGFYWVGIKATGTLPTMYCVQNSELGWLMGLDATLDVLTAIGLSMASTYSNDMPTISSGQSFTAVTTATIPAVVLSN